MNLGVILALELQGRSSRPVKQFLHWIQAPWKLETPGLSWAELTQLLSGLRQYVYDYNIKYTTIHEANLSPASIGRLMEGLRAPLLPSSLQERPDRL